MCGFLNGVFSTMRALIISFTPALATTLKREHFNYLLKVVSTTYKTILESGSVSDPLMQYGWHLSVTHSVSRAF